MATIYKRKDNWYLDYYYRGKRFKKAIGSSKKLAEFAKKDIEVKIAKGELGFIETNKKIKDFIPEYINYIRVNKRPKTAQRYIEIINNFELFLKDYPYVILLSDIKGALIEKYKAERIKIIKPVTVNYELRVFKALFAQAIKYGYLKDNPLALIENLKVTKKSPRFFDKEEIRLIMDNCGRRLYPIFTTLLYTGMRMGELKNLEWDDIDFQNRLIRIRVKSFWEPKNSKPRGIPINDLLLQVLKGMEKRSRWVFCNRNGNRLDHHLREDLVKLCKNLGMEKANIHTFRHTFASHLVMSGVDLPTIQRLMGHADIATTMIYSHLAQEHLKGAVEKLKF